MGEMSQEPLIYTSRPSKFARIFIRALTVFLLMITVGLFGLGLYFLIVNEPGDDYWIITIFAWFISVVFAIITKVGIGQIRYHMLFETQVELNQNGIEKRYISKKENKVETTHIPFEDMERMVVANYVKRQVNPKSNDVFTFHVLLVVFHKNGIFLQPISKRNELEEWLVRMDDKHIPNYYTEYDLLQPHADSMKYAVDFSGLEGIPWDDIGEGEGPPIEYEATHNPFETFKSERIEKLDAEETKVRTQKVDWYVTAFIALFGIFSGLVIFPRIPLDADGFFVMTSLLFIVIIVNICIPIVFSFWRSETINCATDRLGIH